MLVGIISGTYSTIFIAAAIAIMMSSAPPDHRPARRLSPPRRPARASGVGGEDGAHDAQGQRRLVGRRA